jgi:hypothetical protein
MQEEDKVIEEKDLNEKQIEDINEYKKVIVKKLNSFLEKLPNGALLKNAATGVEYKIARISHHTYKIDILSDQTLKGIVISADEGVIGIEINRPGKIRDEYLGLIDLNPQGGGEPLKVDPHRIKILGSIESFKVRLDKIIDDIINSIPYTVG